MSVIELVWINCRIQFGWFFLSLPWCHQNYAWNFKLSISDMNSGASRSFMYYFFDRAAAHYLSCSNDKFESAVPFRKLKSDETFDIVSKRHCSVVRMLSWTASIGLSKTPIVASQWGWFPASSNVTRFVLCFRLSAKSAGMSIYFLCRCIHCNVGLLWKFWTAIY